MDLDWSNHSERKRRAEGIWWHDQENLGCQLVIKSTVEGRVKEDSEALSERSGELMITEKLEKEVSLEKKTS